jgi:glycosyltransferase involved in cell wall biosynthesis
MNQTGISVVMTVFNGERFVRQTIESTIKQTMPSLELIAVDDGSTDSTPSILAEYARKDPRIVVVRQKNRGVPAAINEGIRHAKYDLIARVDSDDVMLPHRLERQLWFIDRHPEAAVVCSNCYFIDATGRRIGQSSCVVDVERGRRERRPGLFLEITHSTVLMRKDALLAVGGYPEDLFYGDDRNLWGRFVTNGYTIKCQNEFLVDFRLHGSSLTMSRAAQQHDICAWNDFNVIRRLDGEPELSREEFRDWKEKMPLAAKIRDRLEFKALHSFKRASRYYGEGQYLKCAFWLATAVLLNPLHIVKRVWSRLQPREVPVSTRTAATASEA